MQTSFSQHEDLALNNNNNNNSNNNSTKAYKFNDNILSPGEAEFKVIK